MSGRWKSVSESNPCPACEHATWCGWDDELLRCQRPTESKCPPGMILRVEGAEYRLYGPEKHWTPKPRQQLVTSKAAPAGLTDLARRFRSQVAASRLDSLAGALGVRSEALQAIGIGWATSDDLKSLGAAWTGGRPDGAWTFPEFNGGGQVCGVSLRAPDGRKSSPSSKKTGARRGLIVPVDSELRPAIPEGLVLGVEGASDVAAALTIRLSAVGRPSNSAGAKDLAQLLSGREVLVLGENDAKQSGDWPGKEGAERVATALANAWKKPVQWSLPPDNAKDLREWLRSRSGVLGDEPAARDAEGQRLVELVRAAVNQATAKEDRLVLRPLSEIESRPVQWLWKNRFPLGKTSMLVGDPNLGKSLSTIEVAAHVTTGSPWPDGTECPDGSVIFLSAEDDPADTIKPRLEAAGADVNRVFVLEAVTDKNGPRCFDLGRDIPMLEAARDEMPDLRLVVIDPASAYTGDIDENRNNEVRSLMTKVKDLAARWDIAVLMVMHLNKAVDRKAMYRTGGSMAFIAAPRAAWLVAKNQQNPEERVMVPLKLNLVKDPTGLSFRIVGAGQAPRIEWLNVDLKVTADEVLGPAAGEARITKAEEAVEWLLGVMSDGPIAANDVQEWAKAEGISDRALRDAKHALGIVPAKDGMTGGWTWFLPEDDLEADPALDNGIRNRNRIVAAEGDHSLFPGDERLQQNGHSSDLGCWSEAIEGDHSPDSGNDHLQLETPLREGDHSAEGGDDHLRGAEGGHPQTSKNDHLRPEASQSEGDHLGVAGDDHLRGPTADHAIASENDHLQLQALSCEGDHPSGTEQADSEPRVEPAEGDHAKLSGVLGPLETPQEAPPAEGDHSGCPGNDHLRGSASRGTPGLFSEGEAFHV